jgi:hypothetical protein
MHMSWAVRGLRAACRQLAASFEDAARHDGMCEQTLAYDAFSLLLLCM